MPPDFPSPPDVGLFTRFVLENPWPLTVILLAVAAAAAWVGLRDGRRAPLNVAAVFALVAGAILATGLIVTTSAEHAKRVTRGLVENAVAGDVRGAMALFADGAAVTVGSPRNPGMDIRGFESRLERLHRQYTIRDNRIRTLRGFTEDSDSAVVHLACWTDVDGYSPVGSQWVVQVARQPDGSWLITRLTFVSVAGNTPPAQWW